MRVRVWVLQRRPLARLAIVVLLLAIWPLWRLGAWGWTAVRASAGQEVLRGRTIVIDPGHGGDDPGAVGPDKLLEKQLVLEISLRLKQRLEEAGARVVLTRDSDTHLPPEEAKFGRNRDLQYRVDVTNRSQADVMISVHANKFDGPQWYGAQVFYDTRGVPGCKNLAIALTQSLQKHTDTQRWIQTGEFYITHYALVPAALVEVGFLSNPKEAALIRTPDYQDRLARALVEGTAAFLNAPTPPLGPPAPPQPGQGTPAR